MIPPPGFVEKRLGAHSFLVVDPQTYPYGHNAFEDEVEIKLKYWSDIRSGDHVVDVGSSWGSYTLPALAQGAFVTAFEPTESGVKTLERSVFANGWQDRFHVARAALWDGETLYPEWMRQEIFTVNYPIGDAPLDILGLDDVLTTRFRSDESEEHLVTKIKIDVEGAELGVLRGALKTIRRHRPFLLIEDHKGLFPQVTEENSSDPIKEILRSLDYDIGWEPYHSRGMIVGRPR
jgi:FkbM family methyltransferase